ncbi:HEPN domain-containing protein [Mycobacteroides abscessus]|uniref:HEPN domain-containing protein n=1 Tax=Mycobacteroides abscessus TaxID=36809 RepID=UPI0012FFDC02|nr:hypothetical protein [Mycobacteroides abscessus subsp. massiliense]
MKNSTRWPPLTITSLEEQLRTLIETVENPPEGRSDQDSVWLTRFLLVRAVGYLEQVVADCVREHVHVGSWGTVRSFSTSFLGKSENPSVDNLLTVLGRLDANLRNEFEIWIDEDDSLIRRDLSAAVGRRHLIAHGLNEGIGQRRALEYASTLILVADWFIRELNPHASGRISRRN